MKQTRVSTAIQRASLAVGGQAALARCLGVSPPTVNQWASGIRPIPAERCLEIEKATQRKVSCEELRPDVDWTYLRGTSPYKDNQQRTDAA